MAVLTAATTPSAQGIIKVFTFASIAINGADSFEGPASPKAYWAISTADPSTDASAGFNVVESGGTYTFFPGVDALSGTLFVLV